MKDKEYIITQNIITKKNEQIKNLENALLLAVETLRHEHGTAEIKNICNEARENLKTQPQRDFELCEWFKEQAKAEKETNNEKLDYKELANRLIDDMIDVYGIRITIEHLYNYGLTKENFNELEFSGKEVDNIIKEYEDNGNDTETI